MATTGNDKQAKSLPRQQLSLRRKDLRRMPASVEGLVAVRPCRFKSCFPHSLHAKDLRQSDASPFSCARAGNGDISLTKGWLQGTCIAGRSASGNHRILTREESPWRKRGSELFRQVGQGQRVLTPFPPTPFPPRAPRAEPNREEERGTGALIDGCHQQARASPFPAPPREHDNPWKVSTGFSSLFHGASTTNREEEPVLACR